MTSDRTRIERAFMAMAPRGIIALADFQCCNSCATAAIYNYEVQKWDLETPLIGAAYFHEQATDSANEGYPLMIGYGGLVDGDLETELTEAERVGEVAVEVLREHGFTVEWDGSGLSKLRVMAPSGTWELDYDRPHQDEVYDWENQGDDESDER